jgi:hypothetical protein
VRGRELDLEVTISDFVARRGPSASSDRAIFHRTNPLQLVGLRRRRNPFEGATGIDDVLGSCRHALPKEGTSGCYAADILHGMAVARSLGLGVWLVDRLRGRRENDDVATEVSEAKIETYFASSKHAGTSRPGAINPVEKRRSGRSELGRRETSGSSSREWRKPEREERTENAGWRLDR